MNADVAKTGTERIPGLGVGFVPEGRRLFPGLTVEENIRLGYDAVCPGGADISERLAAIGQIFPRVSERLHQLAGTLSGGEQSMVALARALIGRPKLVVMDEPSLGLAPLMVERIFEIIRSIHRSGTTMLLVEQNARTALGLADRAYVVETGRIVLHGPASALLDDPKVRTAYLGEVLA
jgi:branched-chain amino acid transport system ATP-binding protein